MYTPIQLTFPVVSYRRLLTPFDNDDKVDALAIVNVNDLPDLDKWREINVREVKETGLVPEKIRDGLRENQNFVFMNRGLVINVDNVRFDNQNSTVTITLVDKHLHGLLDGGHSYQIIRSERDTLAFDQFVKVEILKGFVGDEVEDIVGARNTSNQVQDKSLLNLQGRFNSLKAAIAGQNYADMIAYKENEDKSIDIRDLISYLYLFDMAHHNNNETQPILAYQSKALCLDHFRGNPKAIDPVDRFAPIYPLAHDIFCLWDYIHFYLPELYNDARGGGKFGNLSGVVKYTGQKTSSRSKNKRQDLYFIDQESEYSIPSAMKYPILAAFRAFVETNPVTGEYSWASGINLLEILKGDLGREMAGIVGQAIQETRNPNRTGKNPLVWRSCYQAARLHYFSRLSVHREY